MIMVTIGLLLVSAAYVAQENISSKNEIATNEIEEQDRIQEEGTTTTPIGLEVGVELGTDGTVLEVDTTGVAADGPALITFKTDGNSTYVIAIPSMGLPLCAASKNVADVYDIMLGDKISVRGKTNEVGQIVPCESETHAFTVKRIYSDVISGLTFTYRISPDGYQLQTDGFQFSEDSSFISGVLLTNKKESAELPLNDVPRESSPAIKFRVYTNPEKLSPMEWTKKNGTESNYELAAAEPVEITVATANAVGYTTDGSYLTDTYVVEYDDHILVITGEYIDTESAIYTDLEELVKTISFAR